MAVVRPFRGLRYGPSAGSELAALLSPPYDVISSQEQAALHQQSPYNVVRLELGETSAQDTQESSRYTRARDLLQSWLAQRVLIPEDRPALYLCQHRFRYQGVDHSRWELYLQVHLEEWQKRVIRPHEHTLPEPKVDRLNLLKATRTNISPIYALYPDPEGVMEDIIRSQAKAAPVGQAPRWGEESFALWALVDPAVIRKVQEYVAKTPLYIADGHHRYETALAYQREQRAAHPNCTGEEGFNYVFMSLTSLSDPGLLILPIHRLVRGLQQAQLINLAQQLAREWLIERRPLRNGALGIRHHDQTAGLQQHRQDLAQGGQEEPCFTLLGLESDVALVLRPRSLEELKKRLPNDMPQSLQKLDVTLLHQIILHGYLGIGQEPAQIEATLGFTYSMDEALTQQRSGAYQLAFLINATRVEQIVEVADSGDKMPQKSTFFYPKLPTGLVMSPVDDGQPTT